MSGFGINTVLTSSRTSGVPVCLKCWLGTAQNGRSPVTCLPQAFPFLHTLSGPADPVLVRSNKAYLRLAHLDKPFCPSSYVWVPTLLNAWRMSKIIDVAWRITSCCLRYTSLAHMDFPQTLVFRLLQAWRNCIIPELPSEPDWSV